MAININKFYVVNNTIFKSRIFDFSIKNINVFKSNDTPNFKINLDIEKIKQFYIRGDSVLKMSKYFGVSRNTINYRLKNLGYKIRTGSEANIIRFANSTKEYRSQITKKAHDTLRGTKRSIETRISASNSREKTANKDIYSYPYLGVGEIEIFNKLISENFNPIAQKSLYIYNIDIFINPNIFIEISCTSSPKKSQVTFKRNVKSFKEKINHIAKNKGTIVEINFIDIDCLIANLDNIVTFLKTLSINPPTISKHFVFSCYYQYPPLKRDFNKGTFIKRIAPKQPKWEVSEIN